MVGFGWLHLSDLHQGQTGARWLWPNVRQSFYDDLAKLHGLCGPWDVVLFTGDLTQKGTEAEFALLTETLEALWSHLASLGSKPALVTCPGNHDLTRPDPKEPAVKLLDKWGDDRSVIREFWDEPNSPYRGAVDRAFANYSKWVAGHPLPKLPARAGVLPGDFASSVELGRVRVGIVGLNTAFLQLTGADYHGRLDVESAQMHVACDNDAGVWTKRHHVNLLLTHHPADWLRPDGQKTLHGEIATPGRFAAHLFGHMHRGRSEEIAIGGALPRRSLQAPSLFGLEAWGAAQEDRSHGYLGGRIQVDDATATLRLWPRVGVRHAAGHIHMVQDAASFELDDDHGVAPVQVAVNCPANDVACRDEKVSPSRSQSAPSLLAVVAGAARVASSDAAQLWRVLLGGDPIAGDIALRDLLALGDNGQAELFAHAIHVPILIQARRRLLKYVASRGDAIISEILARLVEQTQFRDAYGAAFLLAAFPARHSGIEPLFGLLKSVPGDRKDDLFTAWGYSGGHPSVVTRLVQETPWAWDKLRNIAFRSACASVARQETGALWTLAELVTHEYKDEIANDPEVPIGNLAIDAGELWLATYGTFAMWPRGAVADEILRAWSTHEHWRVRRFGASILGSFGFSRITTPAIDWLKSEPLATVRNELLGALERSETEMGANAVLDFFESAGEGKTAIAKCAWRATNRQKATTVLNDLAKEEGTETVVALWSLAKLGIRHPTLDARLESRNYYVRSVAALALGYLGEKTQAERFRRMQREAAHAHERFFLTTALAILGEASGADLHAELLRAGNGQGHLDVFDIYQLSRFLQRAILDGFEIAGHQAAHLLDAWKREIEPLDPVPSPVST